MSQPTVTIGPDDRPVVRVVEHEGTIQITPAVYAAGWLTTVILGGGEARLLAATITRLLDNAEDVS